MNLKMKIISTLAIFSMLCTPMSVAADASSPENNEDINIRIISEEKMSDEEIQEYNAKEHVNIGLTEQNSTGIVPYGIGIPTTKYNISTTTAYNFAGSSTSGNLYTNYYFSGYEKYYVQIKNYSDTTLTAKVKTFFSTKKTLTVKPGNTIYAEVSGFSTSSNVYILFEAPSDFSGWIKALD